MNKKKVILFGFVITLIVIISIQIRNERKLKNTDYGKNEDIIETNDKAVVKKEKITKDSKQEYNELELDKSLRDEYCIFADYLEREELYYDWPAGEYNGIVVPGTKVRTKLVFTLEYIDEDDIPELVYAGTRTLYNSSDIYILRINNGKVVKYGPIGHYNGFEFIPHKNVLRDGNANYGASYTEYFRLEDTDFEVMCSESYPLGDDMDDTTKNHFAISGKEVDEETYREYVNHFGADFESWTSIDTERDLAILNEESINKLRDGVLLISQND